MLCPRCSIPDSNNLEDVFFPFLQIHSPPQNSANSPMKVAVDDLMSIQKDTPELGQGQYYGKRISRARRLVTEPAEIK